MNYEFNSDQFINAKQTNNINSTSITRQEVNEIKSQVCQLRNQIGLARRKQEELTLNEINNLEALSDEELLDRLNKDEARDLFKKIRSKYELYSRLVKICCDRLVNNDPDILNYQTAWFSEVHYLVVKFLCESDQLDLIFRSPHLVWILDYMPPLILGDELMEKLITFVIMNHHSFGSKLFWNLLLKMQSELLVEKILKMYFESNMTKDPVIIYSQLARREQNMAIETRIVRLLMQNNINPTIGYIVSVILDEEILILELFDELEYDMEATIRPVESTVAGTKLNIVYQKLGINLQDYLRIRYIDDTKAREDWGLQTETNNNDWDVPSN